MSAASGSDQVKQRRGSKAAKQAQRKKALEENKAVAVEILEVPADGMMIEELTELLATTQAQIIKTLFMKGIAVQMGQQLDKDSVIAVAEDMEVEWIDEAEQGVEKDAKKVTQFLSEDDFDWEPEFYGKEVQLNYIQFQNQCSLHDDIMRYIDRAFRVDEKEELHIPE